MKQDAQSSNPAFYLFVLVLSLGYVAFLLSTRDLIPDPGYFFGNDGYLRVIRVTQLYETWDWYDNLIVRNNAPYGSELHWTRPFDLLLLAGALVLQPFVGFEQGLYLWSIWVGPALFVVLMCGLVWAVTPLYSDFLRRLILLLFVFFQPAFATLARPGRPDHHTLIILLSVIIIGLVFRLVLDPRRSRHGLVLGLALGFGIWLTTEMFLVVGPVLGVLAFLWLYRGDAFAQRNFEMAFGFALMSAVAVLLEVPLDRFFEVAYDKISVVHLAVALLALGFWSVVVGLERGRGEGFGFMARATVGAVGGVATLGILYAIYPEFFSVPKFYTHPLVGQMYMERISELQSLWPSSQHLFARFVSYMGPAFLLVPFLIYALSVSERHDEGRWNAWFYVTACLFLYIPLAVNSFRLLPYPAIFLAVAMPEFLGRVVDATERLSPLVFRVVFRAVVIAGCIVGPIVLRSNLQERSAAEEEQIRDARGCSVGGVIRTLNTHPAFSSEPQIIVSNPDYGPRILYFTDHAIVGSPYHRNEAGMLDSLLVILAENADDVREIIDRRGIDAILVCEIDLEIFRAEGNEPQFFDRLWNDDHPEWLAPIDLGPDAASNYKLYRVASDS